MLFWINTFLVGCTEFIVGCSAVIWYFEQNSDTKGKGSITTGFRWLFKYHMGSIAYGSSVIAICQLMRALFEYYRKKITSAERTKCVRVMICLTGYLLWLMEKCVKYISKNAYIQIALTCDNFCPAAWNSFALMLKNAARFGSGNSIGYIFNFAGIGMIMTATAGCCYYFFTIYGDLISVEDPIAPTIAVALISGLSGSMFLSIFSYSSDAILQAFLLDE